MRAYETEAGHLFDLEHVLVIGPVMEKFKTSQQCGFSLTMAFNTSQYLGFDTIEQAKAEHAKLQAEWLKYRLGLRPTEMPLSPVAQSSIKPRAPESQVISENNSPVSVPPPSSYTSPSEDDVAALIAQAEREMQAQRNQLLSQAQPSAIPKAGDEPYRSTFI
jgi:hypothetical protein